MFIYYNASAKQKYQFDTKKYNNDKKPSIDDPIDSHKQDKVITQPSCRWPPHHRNDIIVNGAYNITICVRVTEQNLTDSGPKKYPLNQLFEIPGGNIYVTYENLSLLPREVWNRVKKPNIYQVYPQDVFMSEIVTQIKGGHPVSKVSLVTKMT